MHSLQALGDPVRRVLVAQIGGDAISAGELAARTGEEFGIGVSAVSQHLAVLKAAGLTKARGRERERLYRSNPEMFRAVQTWLDVYRPYWSAAMNHLGEELDCEI